MNRRLKLLKKLAALADELDMIGETELVDKITDAMQATAAVTETTDPKAPANSSPAPDTFSLEEITDARPLDEKQRASNVSFDPVQVDGETEKQKKLKIRKNNIRVQSILNDLRTRQGKDHVRSDGIFDEEGKQSLVDFAGTYGKDYRNWGELFDNLEDALAKFKGNNPLAMTEKDLSGAKDSPYANDPHGIKNSPTKPTQPIDRSAPQPKAAPANIAPPDVEFVSSVKKQ